MKSLNQPYEEFASTFLAVMKSPAIIIGVVLGKLASAKPGESLGPMLRVALHEVCLGRSVILQSRLEELFFTRFAMVAYSADIEVIRSEKF